MADNISTIVSRQKKLEDKKVRWNNVYSDIGRNMIPLFEDSLQTHQSGERQGDEIFDGTGASALNILTKGLFGKTVNPASTWFKLRFRTEELNELPEVKAWTQKTEKHLYSVFTDSNFYDSIEQFLRNFAGFGTAIMTIEENPGEGELTYININLNQCYISQDGYGKIDTMHRKVKAWSAKEIFSFFGDDTPQIVMDALKLDPFTEFEVLNAVSPREHRDPTKIGNKDMPFESVWILMGTAGNQAAQGGASNQTVSTGGKAVPMQIKESGFKRFPYIVGRWETNGIEEYGRSPAMYALADVMGVNLMSKDMLQFSELIVNPPMDVIAGNEENINFMPRGINVIDGPDQRSSPTDIGAGGYPFGAVELDRKQEAIKEHFFVDSFLFLASQPEGANITATEVQAREGENAMILGPIIGKTGGVYDEIINTTIAIEHEAGRIDDPPAIVLEREGETIDVIYTGPLAQAQRAFFETAGIDRSLESVAAMAQVDPNVLKVIDFPEATRIKIDALGFPQKAIRSREEVEELIALEAQRLQQERDLLAGASQAGTIKDLAKAEKDSGGQVSEALEEQQA